METSPSLLRLSYAILHAGEREREREAGSKVSWTTPRTLDHDKVEAKTLVR